MKRLFSIKLLPVLTALAGGIGFLLRFWLFRTGIDSRGLLIPDHPASLLIFLLSGLYLCLLFLSVRSLKAKKPATPFPPSVFSMIGNLAGAAGLVWIALRSAKDSTGIIVPVIQVFGVIAALGLLYVAFSRLRGGKYTDTVLLLVVAFLMVQAIYLYRALSVCAQVQIFLFPLIAALFLTLTALYRSRVITKPAELPAYVFCNQASVFFCCLCLNGTYLPFFLLMGIWAVGDLCCLEEG